MEQISIIVPVYNTQQFLGACIDSVLGQTCSDFELILVDDGSTDDSLSICRTYEKKDARIRVLHQENAGQAAARNHGLAAARGQWICFVDSDDWIHPRMLERLYGAVQATGAPVSMCAFWEAVEIPQAFHDQENMPFEVFSMEEEGLTALYDREEYPAWVVCAKLIRRDLIDTHPFVEGRVFEDNEAACHWLCAGGSLARTNQPMYFYRTNGDSTTKSEFSLKKLDYLWALENIICFYTEIGYPRMRQRFAQRYIDAAIQACYGVKNVLDQPQKAREVYRRTRAFLRRSQLSLTREQLGDLLDASYPALVRFYWPLAAAERIWKEQGLRGVLNRLMGKGTGK